MMEVRRGMEDVVSSGFLSLLRIISPWGF